MKYEINGKEYSIRQLNNILSGIGKHVTVELQTAALDIMESLEEDLKNFAFTLLMLSLLAFCGLAYYLLVITHRAAGAAYHIHRVIKEIQNGKLTSRVHLREKDEYQELAESFNALMDQMQQEPITEHKEN